MSLDLLRNRIDQIDEQLVALFEKRMETAKEIALEKKRNNLPVTDARRERDVLTKRVDSLENKQFSGELIQLFEQIMMLSKHYQKEVLNGGKADSPYVKEMLDKIAVRELDGAATVAYQGIPGSFSEQTVHETFGDACVSQSCATFESVMLALQSKKADYGVLPIENSSTGAIAEVYDLLRKYGNYIVGEHKVKVSQNLLGVPGASVEDIKEVYSHQEGLNQSREYLAAHPQWTQIPYQNTAISAKYVADSKDPSKAAIASLRASELYGLEVLQRNTNFNKNNFTRFIIISNTLQVSEKSNKISIYVTLPHVSGSLSSMLDLFSNAGINLSKIESRPIYSKRWEYYFYIDFEGSLLNEKVVEVLKQVEEHAEYFEILGCYEGA
ncbi:MAG: chorismate mutase [Clostridiales bacterium]|nr:chorismate mutase [Clostridiales bacterium]